MSGKKDIWKDGFASFCTAIRFLTILPLSYRAAEDELHFSESVAFFPVVGIVIGGLAAGLTVMLQSVFPQMVTVYLLILFLAGVSNFLHLDGVADSGDGLFSAHDRRRSLEIMKDSRIGAMGVAVLLFLLLGKFAALSSVAPYRLPSALFCMPVAGRMALLVTMATVRYARLEGGLGSLFYSPLCRKYALIWGSVAAVTVPLFLGVFGMLLCACVLGALLLLNRKCNKHLGGATGDVLGAQCELAELVVAVCFSIRSF